MNIESGLNRRYTVQTIEIDVRFVRIINTNQSVWAHPSGQVPVSLRQRIEPILDDFERKLRKSGDVRIEDFLDASSEDDSSYLFKQLLVVEVDYKLAHGKQPIPGSYVGRFPHFANDVHSVFDDLHGKLVEANSEPTIVYRTHPAKRERIGDNYRVIKQVGRGAFADVFHCLNERIDR